MLGTLGLPELLFIFGLALLVFGPKRLPEVGRALGKGMSELRKASTDLKRTLNAEMIEQEMRDADPRRMVRDSLRDVKKSLTDVGESAAPSSTPSPSPSPPAPVQVEGSVARTPRAPRPGDADSASPEPSAESSAEPAGDSDQQPSKDGGAP
ncbi:MAG: twin-arginine translocase TatA/TatE family subunit, partial [Acidobacteriota bacterium]